MQTNPAKTNAEIYRLLSAFPPTGTADPDETLRRYFEAVDEFTFGDIEAAVDRFIKGQVPGYDGRFVPTPPMLAGQARAARDARLTQEARQRQALPPPPDVDAPKNPKIAEGLKKLAEDLGAQMQTEDAAKVKKRSDFTARLNARFTPDLDEHAMARRLGFSVGDPDGNEDAGEAA